MEIAFALVIQTSAIRRKTPEWYNSLYKQYMYENCGACYHNAESSQLIEKWHPREQSEQVYICTYVINKDFEACCEFLAFEKVRSMDAQIVATAFLEAIGNWGFHLEGLIGQA